MKHPKRLICSCCGSAAIGRQWWNRDHGYGLCGPCVPFILERSTPDELKQGYGIRGHHFDLDYRTPPVGTQPHRRKS